MSQKSLSRTAVLSKCAARRTSDACRHRELPLRGARRGSRYRREQSNHRGAEHHPPADKLRVWRASSEPGTNRPGLAPARSVRFTARPVTADEI